MPAGAGPGGVARTGLCEEDARVPESAWRLTAAIAASRDALWTALAGSVTASGCPGRFSATSAVAVTAMGTHANPENSGQCVFRFALNVSGSPSMACSRGRARTGESALVPNGTVVSLFVLLQTVRSEIGQDVILQIVLICESIVIEVIPTR